MEAFLVAWLAAPAWSSCDRRCLLQKASAPCFCWYSHSLVATPRNTDLPLSAIHVFLDQSSGRHGTTIPFPDQRRLTTAHELWWLAETLGGHNAGQTPRIVLRAHQFAHCVLVSQPRAGPKHLLASPPLVALEVSVGA
jgi:hypothetical protein